MEAPFFIQIKMEFILEPIMKRTWIINETEAAAD